MKFAVVLLAWLVPAVLVGCSLAPSVISSVVAHEPSRDGRLIDTAFVSSIVKGQTTVAEVREKLGKPASVVEQGGLHEWTYWHRKGKPKAVSLGSGDEDRFKSVTSSVLLIQFQDGKVLDYKFVTRTENY